VPGNITNLADVLTRAAAPQYRTRPDFDPPATLDPAATAVELSAWKLEMDMHFAYTLTQNALSLALMDKTLLKVEFTPTPLHFLTPRQIIHYMFKKYAALTGPDLKKLRTPLYEPLQAVAELETHMGKFVLASLKLLATGHGEDPYRYFKLFMESIKGFPLISTTLDVIVSTRVPHSTPTEYHDFFRVPGANGFPPDGTDGLSPVLKWDHHTGTGTQN
jgi:hypothetical protein